MAHALRWVANSVPGSNRVIFSDVSGPVVWRIRLSPGSAPRTDTFNWSANYTTAFARSSIAVVGTGSNSHEEADEDAPRSARVSGFWLREHGVQAYIPRVHPGVNRRPSPGFRRPL